eukprot:TRINITY_DN10801_c0_g1_i2.p1 TRINITY_DN10801_c0_g1~~TRINITY_DN10801_c0_g1_i2.p1  ORF type:complete len:233 (+),score=74.05 TRINITY_DN10801_c0_g1_i2:73-771(+)
MCIRDRYKYALGEVIRREEKESFIEKFEKWPMVGKESAKYVHMLKDGVPIPSFPKEFVMAEKRTVYYLSPNYVVIYGEIVEEGIPYGDHFYTSQWTIITQNYEDGNYRTNWKLHSEMKFVKKTIFKGLIEKLESSNVAKIVDKVTKPLYKQHIEKQLAKFNKFTESRGTNAQEIISWTPKVNGPVIAHAVKKELRKCALQLKVVGQVLENQRKMYTLVAAAIVIIAILVILH